MITKNKVPPAMFFGNGSLAKGYIKAAMEQNFEIGKDYYGIGFDYLDIMEMISLNYTYLERDAVNMGKIATNMLKDHFDNNIITRRNYVIPAKLVKNDY